MYGFVKHMFDNFCIFLLFLDAVASLEPRSESEILGPHSWGTSNFYAQSDAGMPRWWDRPRRHRIGVFVGGSCRTSRGRSTRGALGQPILPSNSRGFHRTQRRNHNDLYFLKQTTITSPTLSTHILVLVYARRHKKNAGVNGATAWRKSARAVWGKSQEINGFKLWTPGYIGERWWKHNSKRRTESLQTEVSVQDSVLESANMPI